LLHSTRLRAELNLVSRPPITLPAKKIRRASDTAVLYFEKLNADLSSVREPGRSAPPDCVMYRTDGIALLPYGLFLWRHAYSEGM
jgi:hypothetical protein